MDPNEQAEYEQDQAEGMRSQLAHDSENFVRNLKEWSKFDMRDAEDCLLSVIRRFYKEEPKEIQREETEKDPAEDLPF